MRKTIVGLAVIAAIAVPLAFASPASASVSYGSTCTPVAAQPDTTKTVYKYAPVKSSDGPTQWADKDAPANTRTTYLVKGKTVDYFRDGTKTSTVPVPATEATTCGVKFSNPTGTRVNLPDVFDIEHTEYPEGKYWSTQVAVTVTNDTATDQEFRVRYAEVQDGDRVWVERAIFTDGQPNNVVPANSSRVMVFDVWHNVVSGSDVPDDLTLDFGFELA